MLALRFLKMALWGATEKVEGGGQGGLVWPINYYVFFQFIPLSQYSLGQKQPTLPTCKKAQHPKAPEVLRLTPGGLLLGNPPGSADTYAVSIDLTRQRADPPLVPAFSRR